MSFVFFISKSQRDPSRVLEADVRLHEPPARSFTSLAVDSTRWEGLPSGHTHHNIT